MKGYEIQEKLDKRHGWQSQGFEWSKRDALELVAELKGVPSAWGLTVKYRILVWKTTGEVL